jgi:hypothetical protein
LFHIKPVTILVHTPRTGNLQNIGITHFNQENTRGKFEAGYGNFDKLHPENDKLITTETNRRITQFNQKNTRGKWKQGTETLISFIQRTID